MESSEEGDMCRFVKSLAEILALLPEVNAIEMTDFECLDDSELTN